jgi:hypothetical protein
MLNYLEILFWRFAKHLIERHYGENCPDYCEGCVVCDAWKMIEWIDNEIALIKYK